MIGGVRAREFGYEGYYLGLRGVFSPRRISILVVCHIREEIVCASVLLVKMLLVKSSMYYDLVLENLVLIAY